MNTITMPFLGKDFSMKLPDSWRILDELLPHSMPALGDLLSALQNALQHPIGCDPLSSSDLVQKKIVIAVDDISRPTPLYRYFDVIIKFLVDHGASRENMLVVTALGIHRPMTTQEMEAKLGAENLRGLTWTNHNCRNMAHLVRVGTTTRGTEVILNKHLVEADLIVCVGAIEPHTLLGFGGGLKMIVPGLAHERTIAQNHMQGVSPDAFNFIGRHESSMRLDLEEGAQMLGKRMFIINALMNENLDICRFVAGDPILVHREGVRIAESLFGCRINEKADVAIVVSNPMNADLRQGFKCMANSEPCLKEDGLILGLLECKHGIGDVAIPPKTLPHGLLRRVMKLLGKNRVLWFVDNLKKGAGVEERFLAHFSLQALRKNEIFVYSPNLPSDTGRRLGIIRQFSDVASMLHAAQKYAPTRARVYVFPHGGVTYPILTG
jgi:nickel-dependent lactate racemase